MLGTYGGGVFTSNNRGTTWRKINTGLTAAIVSSLAIDPTTPGTLSAGIGGGNLPGGGGVSTSINGGASWTAVSDGLGDPNVLALAVDPSTPGALYAGTARGGVFKRANGGVNWFAANVGLTDTLVSALAIDPVSPNIVYAGTSGGGDVFKSIDAGGSWLGVNLNTGIVDINLVRTLVIDPKNPTTLYAGGAGIFRSTNGGTRCLRIFGSSTDPGTNTEVLAIDPHSPSVLYAGTPGGVFTNAGGATWFAINTGLTNTDVRSLANRLVHTEHDLCWYARGWGVQEHRRRR